jgi:hypothetical protein
VKDTEVTMAGQVIFNIGSVYRSGIPCALRSACTWNRVFETEESAYLTLRQHTSTIPFDASASSSRGNTNGRAARNDSGPDLL